ncbi:hypothetical protein BJX63DRAFT_346714 [Aspergillus granulosus]|uniref:Uncharacterized protein n=1 Tax=Aspergillus granulosus TaxID=176169 RepID=A0ABR4H2J5_9EURO
MWSRRSQPTVLLGYFFRGTAEQVNRGKEARGLTGNSTTRRGQRVKDSDSGSCNSEGESWRMEEERKKESRRVENQNSCWFLNVIRPLLRLLLSFPPRLSLSLLQCRQLYPAIGWQSQLGKLDLRRVCSTLFALLSCYHQVLRLLPDLRPASTIVEEWPDKATSESESFYFRLSQGVECRLVSP